MQLSVRLAERACHLTRPLSLIEDVFGAETLGGSLKARLTAMQAECPWVVLPAHSVEMAVHAALLPTGRVLYFGGEFNVQETYLYEVHTAEIAAVGQAPSGTNVFCSGHAWLADGRLVVAGGHRNTGSDAGPTDLHPHDGMKGGGERGAWTFDSRQESGLPWTEVAELNFDPDGNEDSGGRWYPTLVTLHDGRVLAVGGHPDTRESYPEPRRHNNNHPERYSAATNAWTLLEEATTEDGPVITDGYPRLHLLPGGHVFFSTTSRSFNRLFDPLAGAFLEDEIQAQTHPIYHPEIAGNTKNSIVTSVLLPLLPGDGYQARVLVCGGVQAERITLGRVNLGATTTWVSPPAWGEAGTRDWSGVGGWDGDDDPERIHLYAVLLPTGEVFVTGGTEDNGTDAEKQENAVLHAETYDPGVDWDSGTYDPDTTGSWTVREQAHIPRHYHSVALLLPDGAVWTAGSNGGGEADGSGEPVRETHIELYRPSYMGHLDRPVIEASPPAIAYRQTFEIRATQAEDIRRVALLRSGAATHAFDSDQRYVGLEFSHAGGDRLLAVAPPDSSIAPPGYYLLWVIDADDRPCRQARFVHVGGVSVRLTAAACGIPTPVSLRQDVLGPDGSGSVRARLLRMLIDCST